MTKFNTDHHSISVYRRFDGIDYYDFHYHGIMIISIYCSPTKLSTHLPHTPTPLTHYLLCCHPFQQRPSLILWHRYLLQRESVAPANLRDFVR